jgi:Glycosyltransferase
MKICHVIFSLEVGGTESMLVDILNEQVKTESVLLVVINDIINEELISRIERNVKITKLHRKPKSKNLGFIIKINALLFKENPNIIHFHNANGIAVLLPLWWKKSVLTIHGFGLLPPSIRRYHKIFAVSNSIKQSILNRYGLESAIIYNGINPQIIKKKNDSEKNDVFRILQVSRLDHSIKGQHILIEAISLLVSKYEKVNIHLYFIGCGTSLNLLLEMVRKYKLDNHITFLGGKPREYIYDYLYNCDLLVQPSLNEGFGLTIAEGMAAKIPVLVSNVKGPMEVIRNGEYGYYFQSEDVEDCADKIFQIMQADNCLIIDKAYDYCLQNYNVSCTAKNYLKEYANI